MKTRNTPVACLGDSWFQEILYLFKKIIRYIIKINLKILSSYGVKIGIQFIVGNIFFERLTIHK
jgi:hypothetical protein